MSTFSPNYNEQDVSAIPNCLCGANGKGRDENACNRRRSCVGCGFDKEEYLRRIRILRRDGLKDIGFNQHSDLLKKYGISVDLKLRGINVKREN